MEVPEEEEQVEVWCRNDLFLLSVLGLGVWMLIPLSHRLVSLCISVDTPPHRFAFFPSLQRREMFESLEMILLVSEAEKRPCRGISFLAASDAIS